MAAAASGAGATPGPGAGPGAVVVVDDDDESSSPWTGSASHAQTYVRPPRPPCQCRRCTGIIPPPKDDPGERLRVDFQRDFFSVVEVYEQILMFHGCGWLDFGETCYEAKNADWNYIR